MLDPSTPFISSQCWFEVANSMQGKFPAARIILLSAISTGTSWQSWEDSFFMLFCSMRATINGISWNIMEYHPVQCKFMQTPLAQQNGVFFVEAAVTIGSCSASNLSNWNWKSQREIKTWHQRLTSTQLPIYPFKSLPDKHGAWGSIWKNNALLNTRKRPLDSTA